MKRADEIKAYKDAIRQLETRLNYLKHLGTGLLNELYQEGFDDAIATLEKYLAKIEQKMNRERIGKYGMVLWTIC